MIRTLAIISILFSGACASWAQDAVAARPHGLKIISLKWSKKSSAPYLPASAISQQKPSGPRMDEKGNVDMPAPITGDVPRPGRPRNFYVYSLNVRNVGDKAILGVFWEYVTSDSAGADVNRRQTINYQKIKTGEQLTLSAEYPSPPANVIAARDSGEAEPSRIREWAEIRCVLYADGSVWQPRDVETECEQLRKVHEDEKKKRSRR